MTLDDLKKIANSRETMLAILFYLALVFMFLRLFYWPHREELQMLSERISSMQLEKEALEKFTLAAAALQQTEPSLAQRQPNPKIQILSGKKTNSAKTLSALFNKITQHDFTGPLVIDSMSQLSKVNQNGYSKTPFTINAHGTFDNMLAFIDRLDRFEALTAVDTVALFLQNQYQNDVSLELTANLYQLEDVHEAAPPTKK